MQEVVNNLSMLGNANKANSKPLDIIIGTMPGKESRAGGFFYLSSRNSFWSIMSSVLNIDFKSLIEVNVNEGILKFGNCNSNDYADLSSYSISQ